MRKMHGKQLECYRGTQGTININSLLLFDDPCPVLFQILLRHYFLSISKIGREFILVHVDTLV